MIPAKYKNKSVKESIELQILVAISHGCATEEQIQEFLLEKTLENLNMARLQHHIDNLMDEKLIEEIIYSDKRENSDYILTKKGRTLLVTRNLDNQFEETFPPF